MSDPLAFYRKTAVDMLVIGWTVPQLIEHFNKEVGIQLTLSEKLVQEAHHQHVENMSNAAKATQLANDAAEGERIKAENDAKAKHDADIEAAKLLLATEADEATPDADDEDEVDDEELDEHI